MMNYFVRFIASNGLGLFILLLAGVLNPLFAQTLDEPVVPQDHLKIIASSQMNGLASAYAYQLQSPYLWASGLLQNPEFRMTDYQIQEHVVPFHSQGTYLWGPGFGVESLKQFLQTRPLADYQQNITVFQSTDSLIVETAASGMSPQIEHWLRHQPALRDRFRLTQAQLIRYPGPIFELRLDPGIQTPAVPVNPLDWEMLIGFDMTLISDLANSQWSVIGKPRGEGTRRLKALQDLHQTGSFLVDTGNLLEGLSSVNTNQLSQQRENSLKMAQALHYDAINVASNELLGGLAALQSEQQIYQLPLVSASLKQNNLFVFAPYQIIQQGQIRCAVIGLLDPEPIQALQANGLIPSDVQVLPPEQAFGEALADLQAKQSVDYIAILSDIDATELQGLPLIQSASHLLFAPSNTSLHPYYSTLHLPSGKLLRPVIVPTHPLAISQLELASTGEELDLRAELQVVEFDQAVDRQFLPEVMKIRHGAYQASLDTLLPDFRDLILQDAELRQSFLQSSEVRQARAKLAPQGSEAEFLTIYPPYLSSKLFLNLQLNGLLEAFDAEAMILNTDSENALDIRGPLPRWLVYEQIKTADTLERVYFNGEQLKQFLSLNLPGLFYAGIDPVSKQLRGRDIGNQHSIYQLILPSSLSNHPQVKNLLKPLRRETLLDNPFDQSTHAVRVYRREAVLALLDQLKQKPLSEYARLMKNHAAERRLSFVIQMDNLQLNLSGYNAYQNQAYSQVRETRVTSPNNTSFGGRARLGVSVDNQWLGWNTAASAKYEGFQNQAVQDLIASRSFLNQVNENQDDLLLSSELQLRLFDFKLFDTVLKLTPFVEGLYDSEWTPTLNQQSQSLNPLQSELRGVAGLLIPAQDQLKSFKAGFALRRDFNVPDNLELGLDFKFLHDWPLTTQLSWNNDLNLRYFWPTPQDNASSLGLIGQHVSALKYALTDNLFLRFYVDSFVFQGKRPETSQLGASVIMGIGLGYDRIWKPWHEPLF